MEWQDESECESERIAEGGDNMNKLSFVNLHHHTTFSFMDGFG